MNIKPKHKQCLDPESELIKVNNEIKSYLEKVEFYFEEPDAARLTALQNKRTELELAIKQNKPTKNKHNNTLDKQLTKLYKKVNYLESQVIGLKSKLEKEKQLRVNLHTRVQVYRQEVLRSLYESHIDIDSISWVSKMIAKNPSWGVIKHNEN